MEKITARIILEILGRPAENVQTALKMLSEKIGQEKGVKIIEEARHEPVPLKESKDLFTAFAELTLEMDSLDNYFGILFAYMPAHIEIFSPEKLSFDNARLGEVGNKILSRLHEYDALTKKMITERNIALGKLQEVAPHLFKKQPPVNQPLSEAEMQLKEPPKTEKKEEHNNKKSKKKGKKK